MEQSEEQPDLFTISVGNLPPNARVLIKFTYVQELAMDGANVVFRIVRAVSDAEVRDATRDVTQNETPAVVARLGAGRIDFSVVVAVEMARDIVLLDCPTHRVDIKRSDTKAMVALDVADEPALAALSRDVVLLIGTKDPHAPRLVAEVDKDAGTMACMVSVSLHSYGVYSCGPIWLWP